MNKFYSAHSHLLVTSEKIIEIQSFFSVGLEIIDTYESILMFLRFNEVEQNYKEKIKQCF